MNTGEFNTWLTRHQALFPNLSAWLVAQTGSRTILTAWAKALESCTSQHAAEATDRMLRGVGPLVEFNDWSSLPAVVIQHCRLLGSGNVQRSGDANYVSGAALLALRKSFREDAPASDAEEFAELDALIEVMDPDDYEDTKQRVLNRLDANGLGALSAYRLLVRLRQRAEIDHGGTSPA
jgi:hypothetical protein